MILKTNVEQEKSASLWNLYAARIRYIEEQIF